MNDKSLRLYIGHNANYYLRKWSVSDYTTRANTWNWAAFFFSLFWLAYRKMYGYLMVFTFLLLLFLFISLAFAFRDEWMVIMVVIVPALVGYFGNRLYYFHIENQLTRLYARMEAEDKLDEDLQEMGGVSWYNVIGYIFVIAILVYFLVLLFNRIPDEFRPMNLLKILF